MNLIYDVKSIHQYVLTVTANLEKASTSTLVDVALSIDSLTDSLGASTALSKDNE